MSGNYEDNDFFEIEENPVWADKVHGWGIDTPVKGGEEGQDNVPIKELAHRTDYLNAKKAGAGQVFYPGRFYEQWPDGLSPLEAGLPGSWEIWSGRAVLYGVSQSPPASYADYYSIAGTAIAAGAAPVVCYHKPGDDARLYRFTAQPAAYTVPAELDPVKWEYLAPSVIDGRRKCGNALDDDDLEIGDQVLSGPYQDFYVCEVIVPGGKFAGIEGGFRPTFISGGAQEDRIRDIEGIIGGANPYPGMLAYAGAFYQTSSAATSGKYSLATTSTAGNYGPAFKAGLVVSTGPDNSPRALSKRLWRLVSL
jgi:hypothetical protein